MLTDCLRLLTDCLRLLTDCLRLLGRGEAVRRESRQPAEVTDGRGRVVLLAVLLPAHELHDVSRIVMRDVLLPAHELHDVTGNCLPHRLVGGGLPGQTDRDGARVDDLRVCDGVGHAADGARSRLSQLGLSAQGAAFPTGEDSSPLLFLLLTAGDRFLHPGALLRFLLLIANAVHEDQFLAVSAQGGLIRECFSIISRLPDNMEAIESFLGQLEFECAINADQIFDPGQRNDGLHFPPFPIKEPDAKLMDLLCKLPQRVACHPKDRTMGIEAQDPVDRVILRRGHVTKLLCAIQMGDHAGGLVHLLHTARHLASLHAWSVVLVVVVLVVLGIIGLFRLVRLLRLGGRPPVVAVVLHLLPVGVVAGQTAVVAAGEGVIGDLADHAAADGRSFAAGACACLGLHLSVAGDDDVIGIAGRRIRGYLRPRTRAVADACRAGAGVAAVAAARGRHLAAGNLDVAARAVHTAADTGSTLAAHGFYRAAGDLDVSGTAFVAAADACAVFAAFGGEGAFGVVVVLDGQLAGGLIAILLKTRIAAAALQLVGAVQLDGGIVVTLHGDGGFARIDWAVTADVPLGLVADVPLGLAAAIHLGLAAAVPLLLAADVDLQVVEGDVHVALGGVDGDGVLIRLAGDDGLPLILLEILFTLLDIVIVSAFIARTFDRNVAVGDVPCFRIGRDAGTHHDARDDGGGHAPPECAFQSHSTSPFVLCIMQCRRCGSGSPLRCLFLWAVPSPPAARALSHPGYPAGHPSRH